MVSKKKSPRGTNSRSDKNNLEKEKNLGGRPEKELDIKALKGLCEIQCTAEECAAALDMSTDTLNRRLNEEVGMGFAEFFKVHRQPGLSTLRRKQFLKATNGDTKMLIHLGKNWLGQSDKVDMSSSDGSMTSVQITRVVIDGREVIDEKD
jgi:hypothetical protein